MNSTRSNNKLTFKLSLLIGIVFVFFNCKINSLNNSKSTANSIKIVTLEAINISENLTSIATQNDEIFFAVHFLQKEENHFTIKNKIIFPYLVFDSLRMQHPIFERSFSLKGVDYVTFSLVELDDYDSHEKVEKILSHKVSEGFFLEKINKAEMDSILSNDDFLGLQYLAKEFILKDAATELKISGMQMFDKYEYRIHITSL